MRDSNFIAGMGLIIVSLLIGIYIGSFEQKKATQRKREMNWDVVYIVKVLNDHEVQFAFPNDTVVIYLENAYCLSDEEIAFIKK